SNFTFQLNGAADGIAFVVQGYGPGLLGAYGSGLGYAGITRSAAVKFDLHDDAGEGPDSTGLVTNGAWPTGPAVDLRGTGIDWHGGHVFAAALAYDGAALRVTITDTATGASASQRYAVDLPGLVGAPTAYVGFTGATGGYAATQDILNWTFHSGTTPPPPVPTAPWVVSPASASPAAVSGTTTALHVLGGDAAGEAGLTY